MDIIARLRQELDLRATDVDGRPELNLSGARGVRWPRKLNPQICVAIDPSVESGQEPWPLPRFEILAANLDTVNLKTVTVGLPRVGVDQERLMRVTADLTGKRTALDQAQAISQCLLWIGHDTIWRHVAEGVGVPQVVILSAGPTLDPVYEDTHLVEPSETPSESKALGPISVTAVAEAVTAVLKRLGRRTSVNKIKL